MAVQERDISVNVRLVFQYGKEKKITVKRRNLGWQIYKESWESN